VPDAAVETSEVLARSGTGRGAPVWETARGIAIDSVRDLLRSWRSLAITDIAWKILSFALLTPAAVLLLRWMMSRADAPVVADTDLVTFFLATPAGIAMLVVAGAVAVGITALEIACLMAIGVAARHGRGLNVREALMFGVARAPHVLRLTANMVVRLLAGLLPFLLGAGLTYWLLLSAHDINYYLAEQPPAFWVSMALAAAMLAALATLLVRTVASWVLALPLVLFENVVPRRALGESARRARADRPVVVISLVAWAILAVVLLAAAAAVPEAIGRSLAPRFSGSLALLLTFISGIAFLWGALGLMVGIVNVSLFALIVVRLYEGIGGGHEPLLPGAAAAAGPRAPVRIPRAAVAGVGATVILAVVGFVLLAVVVAGRSQPVMVIAHRGSASGPENSLAAFRFAIEQGADFIELDVQESADGEVLVVHDSDLMRVGASALKIWEADAAQLRGVDIGSHAGSQFSAERLPTLAEALAVAKGRARVIVELKSYGHAQRLEEKVVAIVEAAGMVDDCVFMSLDHDMVRRMKQLRPSWRAGVLVAKAVGDLTSLGGDFLAVEARLATRSFVRRAHRAGQEVYVWTVNDPAWMLSAMSSGVDGLITDKPDVARIVVERRALMSDAQRVLVALLVRLGARTEALAAEDALRP
jgi:glycerophosphoryl diester phosphodiesterase